MFKHLFAALTLLLALFIVFSLLLKKDKTVIQNNQTIISKSKTDNAFYTTALINGVERLAMIDTGANSIAMSEKTADELGLDYKNGVAIESETANGTVKGTIIRLNQVKIGNIERQNVKTTILKSDMKLVLIGMSFLGKLNVKMTKDKIILSESI